MIACVTVYSQYSVILSANHFDYLFKFTVEVDNYHIPFEMTEGSQSIN